MPGGFYVKMFSGLRFVIFVGVAPVLRGHGFDSAGDTPLISRPLTTKSTKVTKACDSGTVPRGVLPTLTMNSNQRRG